jgi:DNA-binding transcriptional ArsR family regulator
MAADLLETIRAEIDARLGELRPFLDEYEQLLSADDALMSERRSVSEPPASRRAASRTAAPDGVSSKVARSQATGTAGPGRAASIGARSKAAGSTATPTAGKRGRGAAGRAVLAALEHGSHTIAELVVVTALPAPAIRHDLRPLLKRKAIVKTDRDGKTAYALPG